MCVWVCVCVCGVWCVCVCVCKALLGIIVLKIVFVMMGPSRQISSALIGAGAINAHRSLGSWILPYIHA